MVFVPDFAHSVMKNMVDLPNLHLQTSPNSAGMDVKEIAVLSDHTARVWQVASHPSNKLLASCSADQTARIYNEKLELVETLKGVHTRSVRSVAWKPGPPVLALGSFDATLSIFAFEDPKWEFLAQLEGHENEVKRVAWSASQRYLASCSRDKSVWIWEVDEDNEDFECVAVLTEHTQDVKHVAWHPSEDLLASCSYDNSIRLWRQDEDDWTCTADIVGNCTVWSCDFDPSTTTLRLAASDDDGVIKVYKRLAQHGGSEPGQLPSVARWESLSEEWELECELPKVHSMPAYGVKWSPSGNLLASVGGDGLLAVYKELSNGVWTVLAKIEQAHGVYEINSVTWLGPDKIVTGGDDSKVRVFQVQN